MTRRPRRGGCVAVLLILVLAAAAVIVVGPGLLNRYGDRLLSQSHCTVTLAGDAHTLTAEQANNAALISARSIQRRLPARAATIGIATAIQESSLRNINYGDRDSLGLFQQRPSQGWGSEEQVMDPYYSTDKFYEVLVTVRHWRDLPITEAAQAVQRSAFPEAYGNREPEARLWASALRGFSGPSAVTCKLGEARVGSVEEFVGRVAADFGDGLYQVEAQDATGRYTAVTVTPLSGTTEDLHALAAWSIAVASSLPVHSVTIDGEGWSRSSDEYQVPDGGPAGAVTVELRTQT
ncbi:MAG: hypothetical protein CVT64_07560 [Actinobacteria bacterium HGW-Actinobacteria-4]|nr:MAG: hypothetical protein CVT64_07560 [Actinobacteria bacterium HGW-Actinobacteria-4]